MKLQSEPIDYALMHPLLLSIVDMDFSKSADPDTISNSKEEVRFRLAVMQNESETLNKEMLVMYRDKNIVFVCVIKGEEWDRKEINMSVVPKGLESLFLVSYLENLVIEMEDPVCDYDLCQYLCGEADLSLILDLSDHEDDVWI